MPIPPRAELRAAEWNMVRDQILLVTQRFSPLGGSYDRHGIFFANITFGQLSTYKTLENSGHITHALIGRLLGSHGSRYGSRIMREILFCQ